MSEGLLLLLDVAFVLHLVTSVRRLPDRVASHFQMNGDPDGWISRRTYLVIMAGMGPGLSLVWFGLIYFCRNPQLQALVEHLAWVGCLLLAFIFGAHWLTVKANHTANAKMQMPLFWCFFVVLQLGLAIWVIAWPN